MPTFRPGKPRSIRTLTADKAAATTPTTIVWDADDSEGDWGLGTDLTTLVVARSGLYAMLWGTGHSAGTSAQAPTLQLVRNGVVVAQTWGDVSASVRAQTGAYMAELAVGDTLIQQVIGAYSGGKLITAAHTRFAITRVGPVRWTG